MGNSTSSNNPNRTQGAGGSNVNGNSNRPLSPGNRNPSASPSPGNPHRSLRTKKKSLELPDLASLMATPVQSNRGRAATKAQAIPIPTVPEGPFNHYQTAQGIPPPARPRNLPSTDLLAQDPPSTHQPFPPLPRGNGVPAVPSAPRGRQQPISSRAQQAQALRLQELYAASHQPAAPPSSPAPRSGFIQETVRSSIPIALGKAVDDEEGQPKEDLLADPVAAKIVWKGGGNQVVLARAGDDEWKGRQPMTREGPNVWTLTVMLRPGTHHVRFLVDNQWRVADDLPTAVDDQGSLANYVAVPLNFGLSPPPPAPAVTVGPPTAKGGKPLPTGQSFWSADSADGESEYDCKQPTTTPDASGVYSHYQAQWTDTLPPELIEAARQEEEYLAASAGQYEASTSSTRVTGFVPAPNIPPAPSLPRHLDKLILNTKLVGTTGPPNNTGSGTGAPGTGASAVGAGQGSHNRREKRERDHRERERERRDDRERERGTRARRANVPPPPPPSENGVAEEEDWERGMTSSYVPPQPRLPTELQPINDSSSSSTTTPLASNTASTTPQTSLPTTPTAPLSPPISPPKAAYAAGISLSSSMPNPTALDGFAIPPSLSSTTNPLHQTHSQPLAIDRAPLSGSRTITIDTANMPSLTDDGSVLPVPSHVVLHHLSTSAIRNGVLAVGNTTRYRKKYLTTIYYKPT